MDTSPVPNILNLLATMAQHHSKQFEQPIAADPVTGKYWLQAAMGTRDLLGCDCSGNVDTCEAESLFWRIIEDAGFDNKLIEETFWDAPGLAMEQ